MYGGLRVRRSRQLSVVIFSVSVTMVRVLEEHLLCDEIDSKCTCSNAEAGEGALESVPPREGSSVSPCLAVQLLIAMVLQMLLCNSLLLPGVPRPPLSTRGSSDKLLHVETGRVRRRHVGDALGRVRVGL